MGSVIALYISLDKGLPMQQVSEVNARAGAGLEGDRYASRKGAYSNVRTVTVRHVSLIETEAIDAANAEASLDFSPAETRRNILTRDIDLNALVGKEFSVGLVRMRGVELCDPCNRPGVLIGKDGQAFAKAFTDRGGLRAEVLSDGVVSVGDRIVVSR